MISAIEGSFDGAAPFFPRAGAVLLLFVSARALPISEYQYDLAAG